MTRLERLLPALILIVLMVMVLAACPGQPRYSDDPEAARIQALTDFCLGYGALRDAATIMIKVDTERENPILSVDLVTGYRDARAFIKPFCAPEFDPRAVDFSLEALQRELLKIRLVVLKKEEG